MSGTKVFASWLCAAGACGVAALGQNTFPSSGNVGIGTTSPVSPLQVVGPSTIANATFGAGDQGTFDVMGTDLGNGGYADLSSNAFYSGHWNLRNTANDAWVLAMNNQPGGASGSGFVVLHAASGSNPATLNPLFVISPGGNVGIGLANPWASLSYMLQVAGSIGAEEVVVSSNAADYVFDPGYKLTPLSQVSQYIKENHHLPEIPSAKEVQEKGVNLGEMQTKLLAKIEELTLHMIQAEEENRQLRERIERLEAGEAAKQGGR